MLGSALIRHGLVSLCIKVSLRCVQSKLKLNLDSVNDGKHDACILSTTQLFCILQHSSYIMHLQAWNILSFHRRNGQVRPRKLYTLNWKENCVFCK